MMWKAGRWALWVVLALAGSGAAWAQPGTDDQPLTPTLQQPGAEPPSETYGGPFWQRSNLLGDPASVRSRLAARGVTFGLLEQAEVLGNVSGGTRRGAAFDGLLTMSVGLDTGTAGLWPGGTFNASAFQIHGRSLSLDNLNNTGMTVSSIEALRGALLFELWFEQVLLNKRLSVRVGQMAADQEFMTTQYGGLFINHTFGWSTQPSSDLPSGGPSYPLATPGVRVRFAPSEDTSLLLGVFNGDPAGPGMGISQQRNPSGTAFRLRDGVFVIGEAQYQVNGGENASGLAGTYKLGGWYNSQNFADQRRDALGQSLGSLGEETDPQGRSRRGNWGVYAVMDQLVWREAGAKDQGIGVFARVMGSPGDRNLVNFYADAGVTWKGVIPGRANDTAGLGVGFARASDTVSQLDKDVRAVTPGYPIRRVEALLELTYQAQVAPWWQVQPTAQYVFNLNAGVPNPRRPDKRLGDAAVFGLRTAITF